LKSWSQMRENQTYQGPDKDIASPSLNTTKILGFKCLDVRYANTAAKQLIDKQITEGLQSAHRVLRHRRLLAQQVQCLWTQGDAG